MADISKIKLGEGDALNLKDAQGRANMTTLLGAHSLTALGEAAWKGVAESITTSDTGLATGKQVYDAIASIGTALRFVGIATKQEGETELEAVNRTFAPAEQQAGAVAICGVKEFICAANGVDGAMQWNEFGDVSAYETAAHAAATYVAKTLKVAGLTLESDISVAALQGALGLGALAYKNNASGSVQTVDKVEVTAAKPDTYSVSSQTVAVPDTYNPLDVTPAGNVSITKATGASVSYDKVSGITVSGAAAGEGVPNYTPAGTVSKPNINASITLAEESVATVTSAGTGYSLTDGSISAGTDTTSNFVTDAIVAAIDETDTEMLVFSPANKGAAVTASKTWTLTNPTLSGSLPTFGTKDVVVKTGSTVNAELAAAPTFTGTGAILSAEASFASENASVTDAVYNGGFSGTTKSVTPSVLATKNETVSTGTVTVESETVEGALTKTPKTVTVS